MQIIKKALYLALIITMVLFSASALAHSGRTDKIGGHTDSVTGEYHYHHGHEAHLHEDGVCPFGDYEQWLAEHGEEANYSSEVMTYSNAVDEEEETSAWVPVGIGVGAAAAASAVGYGVYKTTKRKKALSVLDNNITEQEYDPHMTVYVSSVGSRFHKQCGCCNAMDGIELEQALHEGREACPLCCDESMMQYAVKLNEGEVVVVENPTIEYTTGETAEEVATTSAVGEQDYGSET